MTAAGAAHVSSHLEASEDGQRYAVAWTSSTAYTADPEDVPPQGELRLIFEDADFLVVEKPAYLPTENTRTIKDSVRSRLEASHGGGLSIVHRLDWETSGLLVVARTREAARALGTQFANRTVLKAYVADVLGTLPASRGEVRLPLAPDELRRPRQCVDFGRAGKPSCTRWEVMAELRHGGAQAARLRLDPETGRRHQLRMHCLAGLGCPTSAGTCCTRRRRRARHHRRGARRAASRACLCLGLIKYSRVTPIDDFHQQGRLNSHCRCTTPTD